MKKGESLTGKCRSGRQQPAERAQTPEAEDASWTLIMRESWQTPTLHCNWTTSVLPEGESGKPNAPWGHAHV